ncbi:MAG: hypothetical protein R6U62_01930 [Bacteroidales bacterium]
MRIPVILLSVFLLVITGFVRFGSDRIMLHMESQSLQRGKTATLEASMFYQSVEGKLITKFLDPVNEVMITNREGELTIYNEEDNTVYRTRSLEYSSENNLMYFFLNDRLQDLGLRQIGFTQTGTSLEDGLMITQWSPPASMSHLFSRVELVHDDYMPIYAGYYDADHELVKKIYYSDYEIYPDVTLPMTITEFNYLPGGDSIVNRVRFYDVRMGSEADSPWFDFDVPEDATIIN